VDRVGGRAGGIRWLVRRAVEHPGELAADFREFFHVGVGGTSNRELWLLMRQLLADPRSRFQAAVSGWSHPMTREGIVALEQLDLLFARYLPKGKFRPHPRPWSPAKRVNTKKKRTAREVLARLRPNRQRPLPPPPV
jgi:hypothetical protein